MGVVYEVEHIHTGQRLALKLLTQQLDASAERFKREARAASSIQSDHIVRVTDAEVAPELSNAPYLVMELLEGGDLARVTGDQPTSPGDVVGWLRQVARALAKAHARGIVHRDLKPENLFLTEREDGSPLVKVLDFGIAKMAAEATALTHSDSFLGTPGYMSPEQTDSKGPPVTFRADLYALGLIAFKLLTGRSYWRTGSLAQLLAQIVVEPMAPPSERGSILGAAFDEWFLRACNRDPSKRFASAIEQVEALAGALGLPENPRLSDSAPRSVLPAESLRQTSAGSFNASSRDVNIAAHQRVTRRRWLAGGLAGAVVVLGIASRFMLGATARVPTDRIATPSVHASFAPAPSAAPSLAPLGQGVMDAAAPSVDHPSPSPAAAAASAATQRGASGASRAAPTKKGSPVSPPSDTVWNER